MLVLARKRSEVIVITAPDGVIIVITIVGIRGDYTRIGIDAPREYAVHRGEIQAHVDHDRKSEREHQ